MSWGKASAPIPDPTPAGIDSQDASTSAQADPYPWWIGVQPVPLEWIVPEPYNIESVENRQKVGKKTTTVGYDYYGDVAATAGLGLVSRITAIESDGNIVWQGSASRPDSPSHPDYYVKTIETAVGTFHISWGRWDTPEDAVLLKPLGDENPARKHPAYRGRVRVVIKRYYFGSQSTSVPNTRVFLERTPMPEVGTFPRQGHVQGESIVAGILELATNPVFGAGIEASRFDADAWESLSTAVVNSVGRHSPFLNRPQPVRDVLRDLMQYYDGGARIESGMIAPFYYPHSGSVPAGLPELSVHDFVDKPGAKAPAVSRVANEVTVVYRDRNNDYKESSVTEIASDAVEARKIHEAITIEMPAIVDASQAAKFAAEAAATAAEGEWQADGLRVRRARAAGIKAGDLFNLDLLAAQTDQVCRVLRRMEPFRGPVEIDAVSERGVFPTPYERPPDLRPDVLTFTPDPIAQARVFELPAGLITDPVGLWTAFLCKRPPAVVAGETIRRFDVVGFYVNHSASGSSYDWIGGSTGWAIRGVLRASVDGAGAYDTVQVTLDSDNIDTSRFVSQSALQREDDNMLLIVGDEVMSCGNFVVSGLDRDIYCKRAVRQSAISSHASGAEVWLVYRDELQAFWNRSWVEDTAHFFKLQPYMAEGALELSEVTAIEYSFRDREDEAPGVSIITVPASAVQSQGAQCAVTYSDTNADLVSYRFWAVRYVSGSPVDTHHIEGGAVDPSERAGFTRTAQVALPYVGAWRLFASATDARDVTTEVSSSDFIVSPLSFGTPSGDPPTSPTASTYVTTGASPASDGRIVSYIDINVPGLPDSTTVLQALLMRTDVTAQWRMVAQFANGSTVRVRVDELTPGRTYHFATQTFNAYGDGSAVISSTSSPFVAGGDTTAPATPTGLTADQGTGRVAVLRWNANTEADLSEYEVWRNTSNTMSGATKIADADANFFNDTSVAVGTTYYYAVKAVDTTGNASAFSSINPVTIVRVPSGDVDDTAPSNPGAITLSGSGVYPNKEFRYSSYLTLSVPALPSGARWQNILYRVSGASEWQIGGQVANVSGSVSFRLDDLASQVSYEVALQAFSFTGVASSVTTATSSPFTTPGDVTAPDAPTDVTLYSPSERNIAPRVFDGIAMYALRVEWTPVTAGDLARYEVAVTSFGSSPTSETYWDKVPVGQEYYEYYSLSVLAGSVHVRAVDHTGNASAAATTATSVAAKMGRPMGTITGQNTNDALLSSLKIAATTGSSIKALRTVYPATQVVDLAGGSAYEDETISLANRGFSAAATAASIQVVGDSSGGTTFHLYRVSWVYDHADNTSTQLRIRFSRYDGTNLPAISLRIAYDVVQAT